jgi:type II secretory pathway pseudopilin PulG/transcriptional regulator with XRE-family HTH domain
MSGEVDGSLMGPKIGRILEQAREERGLSLHEVEQATKIRARYLKELERENFDVLPAVYVQGSLRTYADYLGLDTEALVRELKFRQAARNEPQRPAYGEPPKSGAVGSILPGAGLGTRETRRMPEEKGYVAPRLSTGGNNLLYLGSAALLVLVLALVAFASTLAAPGKPQISQVREPLASQVPDGAGAVASLQSEGDERGAGEESDGPPPKNKSSVGNAEEKESGRKEQTEESQDEPGGAPDSYASSTAQPWTATAMGTATATAAATATAGASQPTVTPVSPPGPTEPPSESPQTEPAPPVADAPGPAASGRSGASPGRRIVVVVVRRPMLVER